MRCYEEGVLPSSDYYFATPSLQAKLMLYYLLCVGHFTCVGGYHVKRNNFNSILLMYVRGGNCTVWVNGERYLAKKGEAIILNCYRPHEYYAEGELDILWVHLDGGRSMEFYEYISKTCGTVFVPDSPSLFEKSITSLLEIFRNEQTLSETSVSCILHGLLCNVVSSTSKTGIMHFADGAVETAVCYIKDNLTEQITVDGLAQLSAMSTSNFARLFKRQMGYSPYEYIIKQRIDKAKTVLKTTSLSIAEIGVQVGFSTSSNFIAAFRSRVGISPNHFRNLPF